MKVRRFSVASSTILEHDLKDGKDFEVGSAPTLLLATHTGSAARH